MIFYLEIITKTLSMQLITVRVVALNGFLHITANIYTCTYIFMYIYSAFAQNTEKE